jgi:hypothetical protein
MSCRIARCSCQHGGRLGVGVAVLGPQQQVGRLRRLVRVVDAGEVRDLAGAGLGVQPLGVARLADRERRVDEDLDERQAGGVVRVAGAAADRRDTG